MSAGRKPSASAEDVARSIQRMAMLVRAEANSLMRLRPKAGQAMKAPAGGASGNEPGNETGKETGKDPGRRPSPYTGKHWEKPGAEAGAGFADGLDEGPSGWWVLAQGRTLDPENFDAREAARDELLDMVRRAGVLVPENIWVWDESCRAQLVLATLPTRERAQRVAERLREKGLAVTVRREMP